MEEEEEAAVVVGTLLDLASKAAMAVLDNAVFAEGTEKMFLLLRLERFMRSQLERPLVVVVEPVEAAPEELVQLVELVVRLV